MLDTLGPWLNESPVALTIRAHGWTFPAIEAVHVLALTIVVGMIAIVDLRLLGLPSRGRPITQIARETLPWVWGAFVIAVITGLLMFVSNAVVYLANQAFMIKMGLLVLAGVNMFYFEFITARSVANWDVNVNPAPAAKAAAILSLTLWIGVVVFGRIIGFTLDQLAGTDISQYLTAATP